MLSRGWKPDVVAYSSMIHGLCNAGSFEEALKLYNEMLCQESKSQSDDVTYDILFNTLFKQSSVSRAIDLFNSMMDRCCDPDLVTCNIFLTALREKLDTPQDGRDLLDELVGAINIVQVMLQKILLPEASIWQRVVGATCIADSFGEVVSC
ncbi:hypothetical protein LWI28_015968 [Acer negundo]|uniref:Pentatricopeptide repeat-containing protein n=1 Tax=Acer negundo TaxID=4023 RepID=A0AAD5JFV4_ACENE|nr:hypothetical protein LWI28_015968 [Acer negundo]KAK4857985.1 hypothetical protein QYF36_009162 [Acer negundo]